MNLLHDIQADKGTFTYREYEAIIRQIKELLPIVDYSSVNQYTNSFCIIRHDVEFSVDRAYRLALKEKMLGIQSNYFFQLRSNFYNICENAKKKKILKIIRMGHNVGAHVSIEKNKSDRLINKSIIEDVKLLENILGKKIDRFSFHRPSEYLIKKNIHLNNLINAYGDEYFPIHRVPFKKEYIKQISDSVVYLSDSNHEWEFGYPLERLEIGSKKIQILFHPDYWTKSKLIHRKINLNHILDVRVDELRKTMSKEDKTYQ